LTPIKTNVVANFLGQGWRALMNFAFIPLYIKHLGVESYGLIGIFAGLQAWLCLLDMGMTATIGREMARFTGGAHDAQSIWNLLRSVEIIAIVAAIVLAIGVWAASDWLAVDWVRADKLTVEEIAQAFAFMGVVAALRFVENIYVSCISGLQRQVLQNAVVGLIATIRGLGALAALIWISPTIAIFFKWQGLVSVASVMTFAGAVYITLPSPPIQAQFSTHSLNGIWRYAAGMAGISLLTLLLTQVDKLLLSRLLTLESFGYYSLAGVASGALYTLVGPIAAAFYPKFTVLAMRDDNSALRAVYHQGAQLTTVIMGAAAAIMVIFADRVLMLWTIDPPIVQRAAPLLSVLALGTMLNGLMWMPYKLQLAYGWTSLIVKCSVISVMILLPAVLWIVPTYGALGAAWIWVALNAVQVIFSIHFMHRRLLPTEKWSWYLEDIIAPLAAAAAAAWLCRQLLPEGVGYSGEFCALLLCSISVLLASAMAAPLVRIQLASSIGDFLEAFTGRPRNRLQARK
jgi:O-antigen/teichoic acid export membrane protein